MKALVAAVFALAIGASSVRAQNAVSTAGSEEARVAARQVLIAIGAERDLPQLIEQLTKQWVAILAWKNPKVPKEIVAAAVNEIIVPVWRAHTAELMDRSAEVLGSAYTTDELRTIQIFADSQAGQKVFLNINQVMKQSYVATWALGEQLAQKAAAQKTDEFASRGLTLKTRLDLDEN